MDRKRGFIISVIVILVILSIFAIGYFKLGEEEKISEHVQGNENKIENNQKKEISLFHIENMAALGEKINNHAIINWLLIVIIFIILISFCTHHQKIKMPKKKKNFQKSQQKERLNECEGALIEMGYLRKKATNKPNKQQTKKQTKIKQAKKVNRKLQNDSKEEDDEVTELA